ncbi:MAG: hypothetical protein JW946_05210, partial [Candidatus Omnitrophica bacterium]|nr:hypothetical protein [Candidatus Omnitrophota bacterium]
MKTYAVCFLLALCVSLFFTPLIRLIGIRSKKLRKASESRWRKKYANKGGGIAIFAAFALSVLLFARMDRNLFYILFGSLIIFLVGLVDDLKSLRPQAKLISQFIVASLVIFGLKIEGLGSIMGLPGYILSIVWIVGLTNAFNLLDNMDGLAAGVAFIASIFIFIYSIIGNFQIQAIPFLVLALSGASLGFLRYNFKPAKIYMGDSGSLLIGYIISTCSILSIPRVTANLFLILLVPVLILIVPIFDTLFVMILRRMNKIPIFQGGSDHTSHRIVRLGIAEDKAVLSLYSVSIFFGLLGILAIKHNFAESYIIISLSIICLCVFGLFLGKLQVYQSSTNGILIGRGKGKSDGVVINTLYLYKRNVLELIIDFLLIITAYITAFILYYDFKYSSFSTIISGSIPILIITKLLVFGGMGLYRNIWEYLGLKDLIKLFYITIAGSLLSFIA